MKKRKLDLEKYAKLARQVGAESCVLLKNDGNTLPLNKGGRVAVFGRCADYYYKSGLGSGGLVNTRYVVGILDALKENADIILNEKLMDVYDKWSLENPIDEGHGWGTVPWSQAEMPIDEKVIDVAKESDVALIIIGRTAGEDQDNKASEGSYLLTQAEENMISSVCKAFEKTVVILNVGNIIDMKWVKKYNPSAVLYAWQGGQEGGNAVVDVLTGVVNPCGKLTDTIAYDISDYPSTKNFGDLVKNYYQEDIFVGYRYFETFAKDKVLYPFGYGMSYTQFETSAELTEITDNNLIVKAEVKNIGMVSGKEVVQVYVKAPQGELGKPARVLIGFTKTKELQPDEKQELEIVCSKESYASFDDSGITGHKNSFLLECGEYEIYVGNDVRSATVCGKYHQNLQVIEELEEACAPIENFNRFKAVLKEDNVYALEEEPVPLRTVNIKERIENLRGDEIEYIGSKGILLKDVVEKKATLEEFVTQLSDEDLIGIFHGEGMCSPKVTPGTAGAFGGVTKELHNFGIPVACCADGPSGIRMDCGTEAFSLPNGTAIGCTFNLELVEALFNMLGIELRKNKIDTILGPGINIHRNPLNGRNFEYVSEDPLLTGKMCVAQLKGMGKSGVTGTIKHFCGNNQEQERCFVETVVSQRALREIYLKVFEIAVKEGNAKSVMTSYGPVNGIWTAGNYDLCTIILREQWNYKGIVMTDWWGAANWEGGESDKTNRAPMVIAQNDIYMCCSDAKEEINNDNVKEMLDKGIVKRYDLQRNAKNILTFIMESPAMLRKMGLEEEFEEEVREDEVKAQSIEFFTLDDSNYIEITEKDFDFDISEIVFGLIVHADGEYEIKVEAASELGVLAQLPISVYMDNIFREMIQFQGMEGGSCTKGCRLGYMIGVNHYVKIKKNVRGLDIKKIIINKKAD